MIQKKELEGKTNQLWQSIVSKCARYAEVTLLSTINNTNNLSEEDCVLLSQPIHNSNLFGPNSKGPHRIEE